MIVALRGFDTYWSYWALLQKHQRNAKLGYTFLNYGVVGCGVVGRVGRTKRKLRGRRDKARNTEKGRRGPETPKKQTTKKAVGEKHPRNKTAVVGLGMGKSFPGRARRPWCLGSVSARKKERVRGRELVWYTCFYFPAYCCYPDFSVRLPIGALFPSWLLISSPN